MWLVVRFYVWIKTFKVLSWVLCFLKHVNMDILKEKVDKSLKYVSIKVVQSNLQECITWPKKSRKGKQRWNKDCMNSKIFERKLNTQIKTN